MSARRKYPWEVWFGRARTILVRGVHYQCSQSAMMQIVRNNARRYGVHVRIRDHNESIVLQVTGKTTEEGAAGALHDPDQAAVAG